jgi:hypothetical protein
MLFNYGPPTPPGSIPVYLQYGGRGRGSSANHPPPPPPCDINPSTQHTQHSCKDTYTAARMLKYLHTTTHNRATIHNITNVPVVYMALILNGFEASNINKRGIGKGGP